ncbi:MAG: ParB N-terminal domain-containing protein [Proteobacteria bacterium]|nr:ParB N-terminal domain-containing protein [Pseudomonadota bacterium]
MVLDIPLEQIDEGYSRLRLTNPKAEKTLLSSIQKYGQVSPVVVFEVGSRRYEMVDGFKRLRACRKLNFETLQAKPLSTGSRSLKAAMIFMNWEIRSITDLEEGLVIASLHREDSLSQTAIATLLGRHKSWVCRRVALVERLSDDVLDHIRLGLVNPTVGRELSKLPRGNQPALLRTVLKHRLTTRQTVNLVSELRKQPERDYETFLGGLTRDRLETMNQRDSTRTEHRPSSLAAGRTDVCLEKLLAVERLLLGLLAESDCLRSEDATSEEQRQISSVVVRTVRLFERVREKLHPAAKSPESTNTSNRS